MKVLIKSVKGIDPAAGIVENTEYEISERWPGTFTFEDYFIPVENLETPIERFHRLICNGIKKAIISTPGRGYTVDLLQTENYLIVYSHSKGTHWNISGNHFRYYHDVNTGEFIPEHLAKPEKTIFKERLLKAVAKRLNILQYK